MPKRFITYSRTEPARTLLFIVGLLTCIMQAMFLAFNFTVTGIPNLLLVLCLGGWAVGASIKNSAKAMSTSSFWMFMVWLWSSLTRIMFSPEPTQLLWFPMFTVAMAMSVVYIYLSAQKRQGY